jgi:Flp pilus assembly protein protease CpaA
MTEEIIRMILLAYILLGGSMILIAYDDTREQAIPVWELVIFAVAGLIKQCVEPNLEGWMAFGLIAVIIVACQGAFYIFKRIPGLGSGDLALIPLCGLWLHLNEVPLFLFFTGLFGLGIGLVGRHYWRMPTFPMAPSIFLGFGAALAISLIFPAGS